MSAISSNPPLSADAGWRFHHLGVATRRIAREADGWRSFGYRQEGEVFEDPRQGIRGVFLVGAGPRLELLEALPGSTVLDGWLERGIKIYHQAFEVPDLPTALADLTARGAKIVVEPVPAIAFGGRKISFLMLPVLHLIELIEAES